MKTIQTKRLLLRPFKYDDAIDINEYASNEDVVKYMLFGPNDLSETKDFLTFVIEKGYKANPLRLYEYGIEYDNRLVGAVSLNLNESLDSGEIGWILNPLYQKKGIMIEAASALVEYAKTELKIKKIIAHCDCRNVDSYKLMEKLGMKLNTVTPNVRKDKKNGQYEYDEFEYVLVF